MAVGRLPPAGRGPSQAFGLAWASYTNITQHLSSSCSVPDLSALSANVWRVYSFFRLLSGAVSRDNFDKFDNTTIWCLVFLL